MEPAAASPGWAFLFQWVWHRLCAFCTTELHPHPHPHPVPVHTCRCRSIRGFDGQVIQKPRPLPRKCCKWSLNKVWKLMWLCLPPSSFTGCSPTLMEASKLLKKKKVKSLEHRATLINFGLHSWDLNQQVNKNIQVRFTTPPPGGYIWFYTLLRHKSEVLIDVRTHLTKLTCFKM